jgi:hypothetical protein
VVADSKIGHAGADRLDDARAFVSGDDGHRMFRGAGDEMPVAVTHADRRQSNAHLAGARLVERQRLHAKRLAGRSQDRGADLHRRTGDATRAQISNQKRFGTADERG